MNLFVDTNALLSFYDYSKSRLDNLRDVLILQKSNGITLWVTDQLRDKFSRNRESRLKPVLKRLEEDKPSSDLPAMSREHPEAAVLNQARENLRAALKALMNRLAGDISENKLSADLLIAEILNNGKQILLIPDQFENAQRRIAIGNPPGKSGSMGDALHWEGLLFAVPHGEEINMISQDEDFGSDIDKSNIKPFLAAEWKQKKGAAAYLFKNFSDFLSVKFPDRKELAEKLKMEESLSESIEGFQVPSMARDTDMHFEQNCRELEALGATEKANMLRLDIVEAIERIVQFFGPHILLTISNDHVIRLYRALVTLLEPLGFRAGLPINESDVMAFQSSGVASGGADLTIFGALVFKKVAVETLQKSNVRRARGTTLKDSS